MGQLAFKELSDLYQERRPEQTVLYRAVAGHYRTLEALADSHGKSLPRHVTQEFESFLRCGILAYGFLRLQCQDCKKEGLLVFSCKKRGFCSSCGASRMAESASHVYIVGEPLSIAASTDFPPWEQSMGSSASTKGFKNL